MKYTILNVDDKEASLYAQSRTLRLAGFDVLEAATGADTLRIASEYRPQVVLLDVHLPDITGLEVCRQLKANPATATVQVLHISATATSETLQAMALDGGGDGYLLSPVEPALLVATVRSLIRQWQKQEDLRSVKATLEQERSRTRFARMAANYGVWDWNVASGELRWCDELHLVFGTDPSEKMTTARWFDLIHEDDREATESAMRRAADGNERFRAEYRIWRNGEGRWLESIGNRMIEAGDAKTQVLSGITIDVTERKRVEEGLRSSEERFRMATRVANEAIWEWNLETDTVSWSDTFAKLLGRTVENGSSPDWWFSHIYPNDRERVSASIYAALNGTASSWECEYRLERPDGTWANIYDRAVIARDHAGKALRIIGAMLDSTELNVTRHRLRVLTGLLPICSACKKIRDAAGSWHVLESYIHDHSEAKFSHGMCPDCAVRWYGAEAGQATAE